MTDSDRTSLLKSLAKVALNQCATQPWQDVLLSDLCVEAGTSLAACAREKVTKFDILHQLDEDLDQAMLAAAPGIDRTQPFRDRLFDVVMVRFDALEDQRPAWVSILQDDQSTPAKFLARAARRTKTATWALEAAGQSTTDINGFSFVLGLARIIRRTESAWAKDGPDMAKTMAALDNELRASETWIERAREIGGFFKSRSRKKDQPAKSEDEPIL